MSHSRIDRGDRDTQMEWLKQISFTAQVVSDEELFIRLKKSPCDATTINILLSKLYSTSVRKKASALLRSGANFDTKFVLEQWLQLANDVTASVSQSHQSSREEKLVDYEKKSSNDDNAAVPPSPDSNEVIVGLKEKGGRIECWQEVKVLAIALIWLLEEQQQSSNTKLEILSPAHYSAMLRFLSRSVVYLQNAMWTCSAAMMEVTNESLEQVVKALVILMKSAPTVGMKGVSERCPQPAIDVKDEELWSLLNSLRDCISCLLQQHNNQLCLSKAVLSQCGMAYAILTNILLPAECNELRPYLSLFQDASLVCVLHGLMVPLGGGHSYAQSRRQRQRGIERHYKLILQTLMLFTSSQDPVLLTLTVRTIALWANLAVSGCWDNTEEKQDQEVHKEVLSLENPLYARLELVIWDLWDTHVEMAKSHLREIFHLLLKLHFKNCKKEGSAGVSNDDELDEYLGCILRRCMECDFEKKKPYHVLQIVVDHVPSPAIVNKYPGLSRKLLCMLMDQSKSQICQMTLTKMVNSHWRNTMKPTPTKHPMSEVENRETNSAKKYVEFRRVWVDELLAVCRDQNKLSDSFRVNAGFINYIKVLFKVDPNCFQYIMAVAQEMDLTLTVKLMIIKSAIDQNLFAITPYKSQFRLHQHEHSLQDGHHVRNWRGIVSMAVMHEAVWSYSSQVLQDVLWLLVHPTKSTTEPLLEEDIQLLKEFYSLNLINQSPAFRHNVYQWTNRLFLRMRDRLVMKKSLNDVSFWKLQQQINLRYKDFLLWMLNLCWDSFYLDTSFSRRHLCLQFVRDIITIFGRTGGVWHQGTEVASQTQGQAALLPIQVELVHWITGEENESHFQQLIGLFHDSVQMNKDLALDIILLLPVDQLQFVKNVNSAERLLVKAMQFGRSVKSEQYPAAANHFILLTLCPSDFLRNLLIHPSYSSQTDAHNTELFCDVERGDGDERMTSSRDLEERQGNLFILISFLTAQVSRLLDGMAGMKLIEAATTPIHGLLHCIFALIKRVPFFDKKCYGPVVWELVRVCMSACDIVFPVVKQVAPEGYMPPDSEVVLALDEFKQKCTISSSTSANEDTPQATLNSSEMPANQENVAAIHTDDDPCSSYSTIPVTAQMVVFCSWRIVKEACFILADLVAKYKQYHRQGNECAMTAADVVTIADYITKLVVECRHLGAFEKSFLALQQIIKFLWHEKSGELSGLPDLWIERVLEEVRDPERAKRFCLTRRSAGVPRYLEALLTTCPQLEIGQKVKKVFVSLLHCAHFSDTDELSRRSKIHALNILRYLFRCSAIGQLVHSYVTEALTTSLNGFGSLVWPVQNASNLLFTAILSRVFGVLPDPMKLTRKNCMSFGEFFSKFPNLHDFLLMKLNEILSHYKRRDWDDDTQMEFSDDSEQHEKGQPMSNGNGIVVFGYNLLKWRPIELSIEHLCASATSLTTNALLYPILLLLERLFVSENENEHKSYNFFFSLLRYLDWPVARIRLLVARALPHLLTDRDSIRKFIHFLFNIILPASSSATEENTGPVMHASSFKLNAVHGALLTVKSLCDTLHSSCMALEAVSKELRSRFGETSSQHQMKKQWPAKQINCALTFGLVVELWNKYNFGENFNGEEWSTLELTIVESDQSKKGNNNPVEGTIENFINQIRAMSDHKNSFSEDVGASFDFDTVVLRNLAKEDFCSLMQSLTDLITSGHCESESGDGTDVKLFLEGSKIFNQWLSEAFMDKDAFSCECTIALCEFVSQTHFNLSRNTTEHIMQHLHFYAEECQPQLIRLVSQINFIKSRDGNINSSLVDLLSVCSKPSQPESVRMAVAQVLTEHTLLDYFVANRNSCDLTSPPSLCLIWMPVFLLIFDDCSQVRQVICSNVSPVLQSTETGTDCPQSSQKGGTVFSPMKLLELLVHFLENNLNDDHLFLLFESLLQYQLDEICGLNSHETEQDLATEVDEKAEFEDCSSSKQDVLFEPTELNTFKESFRLVETSLNVIGRRQRQLEQKPVSTTATDIEKTIQQSIKFLQRENSLNPSCNKVLKVLQNHIHCL